MFTSVTYTGYLLIIALNEIFETGFISPYCAGFRILLTRLCYADLDRPVPIAPPSHIRPGERCRDRGSSPES